MGFLGVKYKFLPIKSTTLSGTFVHSSQTKVRSKIWIFWPRHRSPARLNFLRTVNHWECLTKVRNDWLADDLLIKTVDWRQLIRKNIIVSWDIRGGYGTGYSSALVLIILCCFVCIWQHANAWSRGHLLYERATQTCRIVLINIAKVLICFDLAILKKNRLINVQLSHKLSTICLIYPQSRVCNQQQTNNA